MKLLALAVLFAVMQTSAPVSRKTADPSNRASHNVKSDSSGDQGPSQQPQTIVQTISPKPDQSARDGPATENAQKTVIVSKLSPVSVTKDWWDRIYITFTGILIVVGIVGVRAAYKTLGEMKTQREAMQGQLKAIKGQLAVMEGSGRQTDELLKHAAAQVTALSDLARAAQFNAKAAKASADALINSERAWVMVNLGLMPSRNLVLGREGGLEQTVAPIRLTCSNDGKTPAWITEKRVYLKVFDSLPPVPDLHLIGHQKDYDFTAIQNEPEPVSAGQTSEWDKVLLCNDFPSLDNMAVVYGIIRYRDIFEMDRETTFGY